MAMAAYSILVGKSYRTADDEVRQVRSIENGEVTYHTIVAPRGPGTLARSASRRVPMRQFAEEVQSEQRG